MASSSPPADSASLLQFLNLISPKLEPLDFNGDPFADPKNPNPNQNQLIPGELCDVILQNLSAFSCFLLNKEESEESQSQSAQSLAVVPAEDPPPKKRARPVKELVRASELSTTDRVQSRSQVRRTRMTYDSLRSYFASQHLSEKNAGSNPRNRADLKAFKQMMERNLCLYKDPNRRIVGSIPGICIGDVFLYRAELCVLGLHNCPQAGIGYVPSNYLPEGEPVATSIVASGGYQDNQELGDNVIMYTGSGGRIGRNDIQVSADQSLERGNLALERSMHYGIEIRVIRGLSLDLSPSGKVYVYDGLYKVVDCRRGKGKSGCHVYLFKLLRMEGQDELGSKVIRIARETKAKIAEKTVPAGYLNMDISNGVEALPVPLFNDIDKEEYPVLFEYVKSPDYPSLASGGRAMKGCRCVDGCTGDCVCKRRNGGEFAYDSNGILLRGRPVVYECGDACHCPPACLNRVTQNGMKHQLEVFRSRETGWGVRSLDLIPAGTFICGFTGDVLLKEQMEEREIRDEQRCLIDPTSFPGRWREWGDVFDAFKESVRVGGRPPPLKEQPGYLLDVSRRRNVTCYISHSYMPNVFVQLVLYQHDSATCPRLMVFAMEHIPPMRELSLDYGVTL